jgi:pimeloyl-ACP methyl ester carboxylesterase
LADNVSYWKGALRNGDHARASTPLALGHLEEITAPTLVVVGSRDVLGIRNIADSLQAKLPNSRLVVFEGADQVPNMEQPDRFTELVGQFLSDGRRR